MKRYCYITYNKQGLLLAKAFCVLPDPERIFFNTEKLDIDYLANSLDTTSPLKI